MSNKGVPVDRFRTAPPMIAKLARLSPDALGRRIHIGIARLVCRHQVDDGGPCFKCRWLVEPLAKPFARALLRAASVGRQSSAQAHSAAGNAVDLFLEIAEGRESEK